MIVLNELEKRYTKDPLSVKLGGIASDLGRLSGLAASSANNPEIFINVLTETKLFTEWAGKTADFKMQKEILSLQRDLATWEAQLSSKRSLVEKKAKKWSGAILKVSGLLRK